MRFTEMQCDALFAAILIDDEVDPETELPPTIQTRYDDDTLADCLDLCRTLWRSGFHRDDTVELADKLIRHRDLDAEDRRRFKHVRAKFKHLRYAFVLYGRGENYPPLFDRVTITMGHLQDAYRNEQPGPVLGHALLLRMLLSRAVQSGVLREVAGVRPAGSEAFRTMLERDRAQLTTLLELEQVTGVELHRMRKIVGRQVSFYDTLRTLRPSTEAFQMSRSLSAINGLMGELHDDLVHQRAIGKGGYGRNPFRLPEAVRERVAALVAVPLR